MEVVHMLSEDQPGISTMVPVKTSEITEVLRRLSRLLQPATEKCEKPTRSENDCSILNSERDEDFLQLVADYSHLHLDYVQICFSIVGGTNRTKLVEFVEKFVVNVAALMSEGFPEDVALNAVLHQENDLDIAREECIGVQTGSIFDDFSTPRQWKNTKMSNQRALVD